MNPVIPATGSALTFAILLFVEKKIITVIKDYFSWAVLVSLFSGLIASLFIPLNPEWVTNPLPLAVSAACTFTGYVLYLKALNRTSPSTIGVLMSARPLISTVYAVLLLSESYSPNSFIWLVIISIAFIIFSWNPIGQKNLFASALIVTALLVWMVGDSMIKFSSSSGMWFVLGRNLFSLPIALAAFIIRKNTINFQKIKPVWKTISVFPLLSFLALVLFFLSAGQSFAIANAVSNSLTTIFAVSIGVMLSLKKARGIGETGPLKSYAFKGLLAGVIAFSVVQLYLIQ